MVFKIWLWLLSVKVLKILITGRERKFNCVCFCVCLINPKSVCNKFSNLSRNSDHKCQVKRIYRNMHLGRDMGSVCHLVAPKGILLTLVRAAFLFRIRFQGWRKKGLGKIFVIETIILRPVF